jgi:methionine-rich copper-binding protein CopC
MHLSIGIIVVTIFIIVVYNLPTLQVYGHASPISYVPQPNEEIDLGNETLVNAVTIAFTETPEPRASSLKVVNTDNERVDSDDLTLSDADKSISVSLDKSKVTPGIYTVDWLVLSTEDGHITKGTYVFTVKEENTSSIVQNQTKNQSQFSPASQESSNFGYSQNITTEESIALRLDIDPFKTGQNTFNLSVFYLNGSAVENIRNVFLEFNNPSKNLGPIVDTMNKVGDGIYSSTGAFLSQNGSWELKITVQRIGEYDINREIELDIADT